MQAYDFGGAVKVLRSRLSAAKSKGEPTTSLEYSLRQAEMGVRMLQATERVVFLDSIVLPAAQVYSKIRLTPQAGKYYAPATFFSAGMPRGFVATTALFANDFSDRVVLPQPDSTGLSKLHASRLLGGEWTVPAPLPGLELVGDIQDYPFVMPDGQTLYFAAQGEEALGGFDIYVTRYDADAGRYLKPAHLGFPFNSTANDYLYCLDEATGIGYFATDRGQQPGMVCLYAFIPNTAHDIYMLTEQNADTVRRAARIASIEELGSTSDEARRARARAKDVLQSAQQRGQRPVRIVIDDSHVYSAPSQLHNETAQRIATEYVARLGELESLEATLQATRETYVADPSEELRTHVLALENRAEELRASVRRLANNMRRAELGL